jgi:gliding motility-associated-like protein
MRLKKILPIVMGFLSFAQLFGAEPTKQASGISVSQLSCNTARIDWVNGDGSWRLILVKEAAAVDAFPVDGTKYTSDPKFGNGTQVGTGNFVCFSNITNNFTITGLKQNTLYHIAIYEHDGLSPDYLTTSPATASFTTKDLVLGFNYTYTDSCQNSNVITFNNTSSTSLTGVTYTWLFKDGKQDTGYNVKHTYLIGGNFDVQLIAIPSGGCKNTFTTSKPVLIVPRPKSKPEEKNGKYDQCFSGHRFFFNDQTSLAPVPKCAYTRTWYFGGADSSTIPTPDKIYKTPGVYRIFFKSETYYDDRQSGCTDTTSIVVRVIADPSSGVTFNDSIQCLAGNQFDFDNVYPGLVSFSWDFGDGGNASTKSASHTYGTIGIYSVVHQAASIEGCKSKDTTFMVVKPNFKASFTGLPKEACENAAPITLVPSKSGGDWYGQYLTDSVFTPTLTGNYSIKYVIPDTFCPDSITQTIFVKPLPRFTLGPDANICNGGSIPLTVTANGSVLWQDGNTQKQRTISTAGKYWAVALDSGCLWSDSINLFIGNTPVVDLPADTLLCKGAVVKLTANWPLSTVQWSTGSRDTFIYVSSEGIYSVTVTNPCGTASDITTIRYQGEFCDVFIPDAFTPNGDGKNEFFEIQGRSIVPTLFIIYDRWGEKVFDSRTDGGFKWNGMHDGKMCIDGIYTYLFRYEVLAGNIIRRNTLKNSVLLYR